MNPTSIISGSCQALTGPREEEIDESKLESGLPDDDEAWHPLEPWSKLFVRGLYRNHSGPSATMLYVGSLDYGSFRAHALCIGIEGTGEGIAAQCSALTVLQASLMRCKVPSDRHCFGQGQQPDYGYSPKDLRGQVRENPTFAAVALELS